MGHVVVEQATEGQHQASPPTSTTAQQVRWSLKQKPKLLWTQRFSRKQASAGTRAEKYQKHRWGRRFQATQGRVINTDRINSKGDCYLKSFLSYWSFFFIPSNHVGVYYFNRQSTCSVEQNKHIANVLWAKWKQSFTAKLWLIYYLKLKLYYQALDYAGGWKAQYTFSWFAPRAVSGRMETRKLGLCHAKGTCTSSSVCTSFDP